MLLIILWAIVGTLAVSQGLVVLFLMRTRGNQFTVAGEILKLQSTAQRAGLTEAHLRALLGRVEELEEKFDDESRPTGQIIQLEAVGGRSR